MVVVTAFSFEFIAFVYYSFYTLRTPLSNSVSTLFQCGEACMRHGTCGGVVWNQTQLPNCQLVVDPSESGSVRSASPSAFRVMTYRDDLILRDMYTAADVSWDSAKATCLSAGLQLLPHPKTAKELALLSIRKDEFVNVDVVRRPIDGAYVDGQGDIVPPTTFNWIGDDNPPMNQSCLYIGYDLLSYDYFWCNSTTPYTEIFCVG